jgi:hypothetical protein
MLNNKEKLRQILKEKHIEGQLCQRNWDLTQEMPEEDVQVILHSVTQCPSKQNLDYYSVIAIQDRSIIENIYYNYTLTAMLGYKTGFNRRFDHKEVHKIIGVPEGDRAVLMLGIGVPDLSRDRKQEHYENAEILSYPKIPINVKRL